MWLNECGLFCQANKASRVPVLNQRSFGHAAPNARLGEASVHAAHHIAPTHFVTVEPAVRAVVVGALRASHVEQ